MKRNKDGYAINEVILRANQKYNDIRMVLSL